MSLRVPFCGVRAICFLQVLYEDYGCLRRSARQKRLTDRGYGSYRRNEIKGA